MKCSYFRSVQVGMPVVCSPAQLGHEKFHRKFYFPSHYIIAPFIKPRRHVLKEGREKQNRKYINFHFSQRSSGKSFPTLGKVGVCVRACVPNGRSRSHDRGRRQDCFCLILEKCPRRDTPARNGNGRLMQRLSALLFTLWLVLCGCFYLPHCPRLLHPSRVAGNSDTGPICNNAISRSRSVAGASSTFPYSCVVGRKLCPIHGEEVHRQIL